MSSKTPPFWAKRTANIKRTEEHHGVTDSHTCILPGGLVLDLNHLESNNTSGQPPFWPWNLIKIPWHIFWVGSLNIHQMVMGSESGKFHKKPLLGSPQLEPTQIETKQTKNPEIHKKFVKTWRRQLCVCVFWHCNKPPCFQCRQFL